MKVLLIKKYILSINITILFKMLYSIATAEELQRSTTKMRDFLLQRAKETDYE